MPESAKAHCPVWAVSKFFPTGVRRAAFTFTGSRLVEHLGNVVIVRELALAIHC